MSKLKKGERPGKTFTFKSFNDLLNDVNINLIKRIDPLPGVDRQDESTSHFFATFRGFVDLNLTADFRELRRKLGNYTSLGSLPQVLHRKDELFSILNESLQKPNNQASGEAIALLSALAKDIGSDFYPYFETTFKTLVNLLDCQDSELIENVFMCLALLFQLLWRPMLKNVKHIFRLYSENLFSYRSKDYIRAFAAQSFTYLARKVPNKVDLIDIILNRVLSKPDISYGVSDLFFEIVKGIKRQLHSCAGEFLDKILWTFASNYSDSETIAETIHNSVELIFHHVDKENSLQFWKCLLNVSNKALQNPKALKSLVSIVHFATSFKNGQLINDYDLLIDFVVKVLQKKEHAESYPTLLNITTSLLNASFFIVKYEDRKLLVSTCLGQNIPYSDAYSFAKSLYAHKLFDSEILPVFLSRCYDDIVQNHVEDSDSQFQVVQTLEAIFELVTARKPIPILEAISSFERFPLSFQVKGVDVSIHLVKILLRLLENSTSLNVIRRVINLLPHIACPDEAGLIPISLQNCLARVKTMLTDSEHTRQNSELLCLQSIFCEVIYFLSSMDCNLLFSELDRNIFFILFSLYPQNTVILQAFLFYIQAAVGKPILERQFCEKIYFDHLQNYLRNPLHHVRLLALMCINMFDFPMQPSETGSPRSVFSIALEAELIPISVQTYREKLRLLNLLDFNFVSNSLPLQSIEGKIYETGPVHYLIGNLYCNFSLIWDPVKKLIETYGKGLKDQKSFWSVIFEHMKLVVRAIKDKKEEDQPKTLWAKMNQSNETNPRIDFFNHRILLLQTVKSLAHSIGSHVQEVVNWLIDFIEEEGCEILDLVSVKRFEDLRVQSMSAPERREDTQNLNDEDKGDELEESEESKDGKAIWNTLKSFLEILSLIKNQEKYDQHRKLSNLYISLLQHKNPSIQKLTLNCIVAYYSKDFAPYKENFYRLLDDSTFKTEILLFSSKSENPDENLLKPKDRPTLMPFLMRILYGKLLSKTGIKTAGKANIDARRSIIFRFLASCSRDEIMIFIQLSFSNIMNFFELDYNQILSKLSEMDSSNCIPLRLLFSYLKTLDLMLVHFGNIATDLLPDLFKLFLIISALVKTLLGKRTELSVSAVLRLKNLRLECFKLVEKYFKIFDNYAYSSQEIDLLFQVLIDPMVLNLENESLESPSPTLRLLYCWSENPRYFILFAKQSSIVDKQDSTPLSNVIALYNNPKASVAVVEYLTTLIANLVSYENYSILEQDEFQKSPGPFIEVMGLSSKDLQDRYIESSEGINFGTILIKPHITKVLERLKKCIETRMRKKSKNKQSIISDDEAVIISHISDHIQHQRDCGVLATLLIQSIYFHFNLPDDVCCKTLQSINSLIKRVKGAAKFLTKIACLFSKIAQRSGRLELCELVSTISSLDSRYEIHSEITRMINAYDPKNPEEPDYVARGDGFRLAKKTIEEMELSKFDRHLLFLLIYNCFFFIKTSDDLGLRESSSACLQVILHKISEASSLDLIKREIVPLLIKHIKSGMKEPNELARHEYITVLTYMVQYLKKWHPLIKQLSLLSDENDPELDFWSNIRHIQVHRRIRALARLSQNHDLLSKFSPQIHQDFLLPIATTFITDLKPTKYGASINYAVDMIGSISSHLPWAMYDRLLRVYLKRTVIDNDNHKTNVRILCSILGNFSFNLKNSTLIRDPRKLARSVGNSFEDEMMHKKLLNPESATRIHRCILEDILPKLHSCLHKLSYSDYEYDVIRSEFNYEDEIHRIPMATAMIKLLRSIPISQEVFDTNVKSIFLRLSNFLKSRMDSIRAASRQTLCKVMGIIGPKYLPTLIDEMKPVLNRGYRLHVLTFSLYIIIEHLSPKLTSGDLDESSASLIEIFHSELFTDKNEEKTVAKITSKCMEAKKIKTFAMYKFLGQFISSGNLIATMMPLKEILDKAISPKVMKKISNCMQKFFQGLIENKGLSEVHLLNFILDVLEDKVSQLKVAKSKPPKKKQKVQDCFLLEPTIKQKKVSKGNPMSNVFVLFENCLKLVLSLFKKGRISNNPESNQVVNKLVPILINSLQSKHAKVSSTAVRCINQITLKNRGLEVYRKESDTIKKNILILLDEFIGHGFNTSENCELITMGFKCLSLMIKFVDEMSLTKDELQMLLFHVDKDMSDRSRRSTAFSLLKSILGKQIQSPQLKDIMEKLTMIMLQSDEDFVREEARLIWTKYLLNYSLRNQFQNYVSFFTRQLEYPRELGRLSVLRLIFSIIKYQNVGQVSDTAPIFFIALSSRLINDDSIKCRELASQIIKKLILRVAKRARDSLFTEITLPWFTENNILHRRLAAQLCGLFVSAEGQDFRKRLPDCLCLLSQQLEPTKFPESLEDEDQKRSNDHLLIQLLTFFQKILKFDINAIYEENFIEDFNSVFYYVEKNYLSYPHMWVRIISVQIIQTLFAATDHEKLLQSSESTKNSCSYLLSNTAERLWRLCRKHCFLFSTIYESHEIHDPLLENLEYIGKFCIKALQTSLRLGEGNKDEGTEESAETNSRHLNISWMLRRMLSEIKREITKSPNQCEARLLAFKWLTTITLEAQDVTFLVEDLASIMVHLCREITSKKVKNAGKLTDDDVKFILVNQCRRLYDILKDKVGSEAFSTVYTQVATLHNRKRNERKAARAIEMITNPVRALKRKAKIHHAWNETKKRRKIERLSGIKRARSD